MNYNILRPTMIILLILIIGSSINKRARYEKYVLKEDGIVIAEFASKRGDGLASSRCIEYSKYLQEKVIFKKLTCSKN